MSITYKRHHLFPDYIYIREFRGRVGLEEIINSWEFLINNNLLNHSIKGVINDLADCRLDMNMDSFQVLIGYLKAHDQFTKIKLAVICDDPHIIVFPTLGEVREKSLKIKPFTSEEAAVEWIIFDE